MSGARRGPERPRRHVAEEVEPEIDPRANMWVQMLQQQQAMHRQYQEQQAQAERHHREMIRAVKNGRG
ncbi:hypothetical protein A2U01_0066654 [Trifolium medium]|uniref:Uncharacterized protein n=1 Tax=Trifolium medium TaxID=97028 RepID=A0A392SC05_9FABA|nr:hypothetical protein [Trifolium medium]